MNVRSIGIGPRETSRAAPSISDAELVARIRAKDVTAFEALYRIYHPRLTRFLINLIHRPTLVEEVLNDTLMVVWEKADTFNGTSKLSTWMFGIAYRKAMKALRKQDEPIDDPAAEQRPSLDPTPEDDLGRSRAQVLLQQAIEVLSPEHRAVVEFTYFHEMGYREIAEIMKCPVDTVKTRMFHARRYLRRQLAGELPDWL
ncbi:MULTISPECIES: RNA polymerase sigma factor [unclassified Caulobacter]|uniref:RNA polymerase sigma factor n=1 Tax=unclassified Caulobacter TaxID=2648921 RepID=UPI000A56EEC6|nr:MULTISPECIES: sigma-70 family RNA polymerase sigma factor [unclassified Caulobacter]